jgi:hypothetical protein
MDQGTIFVFSHSIGTIYEKKERKEKKSKTEVAKNKSFKPRGKKCI